MTDDSRRVCASGKAKVAASKHKAVKREYNGMTFDSGRELNRTGETVHQVLERVTKEGGGKWATIGMVCGMTGPAARNMFIKHGFEKKPIWNFDYRGVNASMLSHCNRLGLDYPSVANYKTRHKITAAQALEAYAEGRVKRYYWGVAA